VFELLFNKDNQLIKWGESVLKTTTTIKLINNSNKPRTIGCKVDGRIIYKVDQAPASNLDICQFQGSKNNNNRYKKYTDRAKLAIECKCLIDDVLTQDSHVPREPTHSVLNIQLCGTAAHISSLNIINRDLYLHQYQFDLSLKKEHP
jgi:hypothetical protein